MMMNHPFSRGKAIIVNKISQLTDRPRSAIRASMRCNDARSLISVFALGLSAVLAGCVQVSAPDKPIVINLNINIKQEVVYRLDGDAKNLIDSESEIF